MKEFPDARFYIVMRSPQKWTTDMIKTDDHFIYCPSLSPSEKLFKAYKYHGLPWEKYVPIFLQEMESIEAQKKIKDIIEESRIRTVFLVCSEKPPEHCHRFLLLDIMSKSDH